MKESTKPLLVYYSRKTAFLAEYIKEEGYTVESMLRYDWLFLLAFEKFFSKIAQRKRVFRKKVLDYSGTIILFDSNLSDQRLAEFCKKSKARRIVLFVSNPVESIKLDLERARGLGIELWSYADYQCQQYNMKNSSTFYCKSVYIKALHNKTPNLYDIVFVGKDKGRKKILDRLFRQEPYSKYKTYFYFTATHFWEIFRNKQYKKSISFKKVQLIQTRAKAIIELCPSPHNGITMRTTDSLILGKKLITDSKCIKKEPFYDENNIFVMGEDDEKRFDEFMSKEYRPVSEEIVEQYDIHAWVKRIINDEPIELG